MEIFPLHYFIPLIASFIGWLTNLIAIKLLFRPKKKIKILFFSIQGIFPKRRKNLTEKLSQIISERLLQKDKLADQIKSNQKLDGLAEEYVEEYIDSFLKNKLGNIPLISSFIGGGMVNEIKKILLKDFKTDFSPIKGKFIDKAIENLDINSAVSEYLESLSMDEIEILINEVLKKEFHFIELSGAVLGFLIGLLQVGLIYL